MRKFVQFDSVKVGDVLVTDGGFTCMGDGERKTVKSCAHGLYIDCAEGNHSLAGQIGDHGELLGLYPSLN